MNRPAQLEGVEFSQLQFDLQFEEAFRFSPATCLQLRRELWQLAERMPASHDKSAACRSLLKPPPFADPVARRRFRQPAPGFVITPPVTAGVDLEAGDELKLTVQFFGQIRSQVPLFIELLKALGPRGIAFGAGRYTLLAVKSLLMPESPQQLWNSAKPTVELNLPFQDLGWWLDRQPCGTDVRLEVVSPLRLLQQGRPLFELTFDRMFPFVLRRVSSMLYAWGSCELQVGPAELLAVGMSVRQLDSTLSWSDWRVLQADSGSQGIGGLLGTMRLQGQELVEIGWLLQLLQLFNLGKGAAYGAGCFRLMWD